MTTLLLLTTVFAGENPELFPDSRGGGVVELADVTGEAAGLEGAASNSSSASSSAEKLALNAPSKTSNAIVKRWLRKGSGPFSPVSGPQGRPGVTDDTRDEGTPALLSLNIGIGLGCSELNVDGSSGFDCAVDVAAGAGAGVHSSAGGCVSGVPFSETTGGSSSNSSVVVQDSGDPRGVGRDERISATLPASVSNSVATGA